MPGGGRRTGAGRPRKIGLKNKELYVSFPEDTADKLRSMIPRGHRSEFISDCVDSALRTRELLNEQRWGNSSTSEIKPDTNSFDLPGAHLVPVNNRNISQ